MSRCIYCGMQLTGAAVLCSHHYGDPAGHGWAATNRVMCDLLHRGVAAVRLRPADRDVPCGAGADQECARPLAETLTTAA